MGTWTDAVERARERWNAVTCPAIARHGKGAGAGTVRWSEGRLDAHADCSSALMYP